MSDETNGYVPSPDPGESRSGDAGQTGGYRREARFDPQTGQPIQPAAADAQAGYSTQQDATAAQAGVAAQAAPAAQAGYASASRAQGAGDQTARVGYASQGAYAAGGAHSTSAQGAPQTLQAPAKSQRSEKKGGKSFLWGVLGVVVGAIIAIGGVYAYENLVSGGSSSSGTTVTINATGDDTTLAEAVSTKCLPSVVSIDVYTQTQSSSSSSLEQWLYGDGYSDSGNSDQTSNLQVSSYGSGVIISEDGYILTNWHVVNGGAKFVIHFDDDSTAEATVVGTDESSDLAVIKVDKTGLTAMEIGDSDSVEVGEWIMAIGSPFGLTKSISIGIVSALYRNQTMSSTSGTRIYANMIQIDADINPGNSGGALVDSEGKLIGINTMIYSYSESSSGVGMAIPANYAMNIAEQLISTGKATHPYLGVKLGTINAGTQSYYNASTDSGAYVTEVVSGSPAEQAGMQAGDVVVGFNDETITTADELMIQVRAAEVGDEVTITVMRDGQSVTLNVTLGTDA